MMAATAACMLLSTTLLVCRKNAVPADLRKFQAGQDVVHLLFLPENCSAEWLIEICDALKILQKMTTPNCCFNCTSLARTPLEHVTLMPGRLVMQNAMKIEMKLLGGRRRRPTERARDPYLPT